MCFSSLFLYPKCLRQLPSIEYRKLKISDGNAFLSFLTPEGLQKGLQVLDGFELKKNKLYTKHVAEEPVFVWLLLILAPKLTNNL